MTYKVTARSTFVLEIEADDEDDAIQQMFEMMDTRFAVHDFGWDYEAEFIKTEEQT